MDDESKRLYAYEIYPCPEMPITPGPIDRDWMDASDQRFAYRCLPLSIANQSGWMIANPVEFTATWDGGPYKHNLELEFGRPEPAAAPTTGSVFTVGVGLAPPGAYLSRRRDPRITSHFGSGIVTFAIPYLFRTPAGVNLWVKGPANWIKDAAQPLEGVVETDWLPATFTMNWKLTRPHQPVRFERGEPICMVVPLSRGLAESLQPICMPLAENPPLDEQFKEWRRSRTEFNTALAAQREDAVAAKWQRDYVKGTSPGGARATEHQTRLSLRAFERPGSAEEGNSPGA